MVGAMLTSRHGSAMHVTGSRYGGASGSLRTSRRQPSPTSPSSQWEQTGGCLRVSGGSGFSVCGLGGVECRVHPAWGLEGEGLKV